MSHRDRHGFTLTEIIVALITFSIVATVLTRVLMSSQRVTTAQQTRAMMQSNLRVASFVVPNELRMLNQSDTTDILDVSDSSITYRAMRGYYVLCSQPTSATSITVTRVENSSFGFDYRVPAAGDSAFIFFENDTLKMSDDRWVRVGISAAASTTCGYPVAGTAARTFTLSGSGINTTAAPLAGFMYGAPVRTYEITKMALYTADGAKWLGMCTGDGCTLQPVVGPLADAGGFLLTRYNDVGTVVTGNAQADRNSLRSLRIRFIAKSEQAIGRGVGDAQRSTILDTLETVVTLRNVKQN
jgi:prepilin-type N-terminal cleavage/methylation domain-containing protein